MRTTESGNSSLVSLAEELEAETGPNRRLDQVIAETLGDGSKTLEEAPPYTSSVDACIALVHTLVPKAHWHVGFGPMGVETYAFLSDGKRRWDSSAPTVPLALLASLIKTILAAQEPETRRNSKNMYTPTATRA